MGFKETMKDHMIALLSNKGEELGNVLLESLDIKDLAQKVIDEILKVLGLGDIVNSARDILDTVVAAAKQPFESFGEKMKNKVSQVIEDIGGPLSKALLSS